MGVVVTIDLEAAARRARARFDEHCLAEQYRPALGNNPVHIAEKARRWKRVVAAEAALKRGVAS